MKTSLKRKPVTPAYISEKELAEIKPDYRKWRRRLFYMNLFIALMVVVLEIFVNIILIAEDKANASLLRQAVLYFLIPSGLNLLAVLVDHILLRLFPDRDWLLNYAMVITVVFMCSVVAVTHYVFSITLTAFLLPILISVVFVNRRLTDTTALCCCIGLLIAVAWRNIDGNEAARNFVIPEMVISLGIIFLSVMVSRVLISMMEQQNQKLINAIAEEKRSQEDALAANKAKSAFLANMSHEIRTPINAVLGMNEMILREEREPEIRGYAENIRTAGNSLLAIVNDVLDISKIESGRIEISNGEYELSSLVSDCCSMTALRAQEKGLSMNVVCDGEIPLKLIGDEPHIRQVVVNLLTNAVKYTENGGVTLTVSGAVDGDLCRLRFSVLDTGSGISEADQGKLFDQFQRLDLMRNRNIEGTGLGLAIVHRLTELMGGTISVKSVLGEGSEFLFEVPQRIAAGAPSGKLNVNYSTAEPAVYSHSFEAPEASVLVVDDLPVNLLVIVNLLKDTRIQTDTAGSGAECLEAASRKHYDLILMDHMMPEMDGVETYRRLRSDANSPNCGTPVIMLTANALAGVREEYLSEGFADYIPKPVRGDRLEQVIRKNLPPELVLPPTCREELPEDCSVDFTALTEALPQLNLPMAMQYCCNSPELYTEVLRDYCESGRYDEMERAYSEKRWEDYCRCVHSLKSTSRTIGLDGLSERARASETALRQGCVDFAVIDHDGLEQEYAEALSAIKAFINKDKREVLCQNSLK